MGYGASDRRPVALSTLIIKAASCLSRKIESSGVFVCLFLFPQSEGLTPVLRQYGIIFFFVCSLLVYVEVGAPGLCGVWQIKSCFAANYQLVEISEPIFSNVVIAYSSKSAREADLLCSL